MPLLGVECEIAFRFDRALPPRAAEYGYDEVAAAVTAFMAIEVVDSRFSTYPKTPLLDRVADFMSNGAFVAGDPIANWRSLDLTQAEVELVIDGVSIVRNVGGHIARDPLLPAIALVNDLRQAGIAAGCLMTTGTYTGLHFAKPGQRRARRIPRPWCGGRAFRLKEDMMQRRLRVGVVGASPEGAGWALLSHMPALAVLDDYELAAVCTTRAESAAAAAAKFGAKAAYHDVNEMVKQADLDLVSVVVKVPSHHDAVMAALHAGKNVYCEWPLGANLAEAEAMAALARQKGVHAMVGLQARADPSIRYLRDLVADGYFGEIVAVSMSMFTAGVLERPASRLWDHDKAKGVSALTVRGIHTMDAMCYCLGDFVEVAAKVTTQVKQWKVTGTDRMVDVDAPDNVALHGRAARRRDCFGARRDRAVQRERLPHGDLRPQGHDRGVDQGLAAARCKRAQGRARRRRRSRRCPVPDKYLEVPAAMPVGPPRNVGHLYLRMARAIRDNVPRGTRLRSGGGAASPDRRHRAVVGGGSYDPHHDRLRSTPRRFSGNRAA